MLNRQNARMPDQDTRRLAGLVQNPPYHGHRFLALLLLRLSAPDTA